MINIVFDEVTKRNMLLSGNKNFSDVYCIGYALNIGKINCEIDSTTRKKLFSDMENINDNLSTEDIDNFFINQMQEIETFNQKVKDDHNVVIWISNESHTLCGLAFICDYLRKSDCNICTVTVPKKIINWSCVSPHDYDKYIKNKIKLNKSDILINGDLWRKLKIENSELRVLEDGKLISVSEDYYDNIIFNTIPDTKITIGELIDCIINKNKLSVFTNYLYLRILKMKDKKLIEITDNERSEKPFMKIIKIIT